MQCDHMLSHFLHCMFSPFALHSSLQPVMKSSQHQVYLPSLIDHFDSGNSGALLHVPQGQLNEKETDAHWGNVSFHVTSLTCERARKLLFQRTCGLRVRTRAQWRWSGNDANEATLQSHREMWKLVGVLIIHSFHFFTQCTSIWNMFLKSHCSVQVLVCEASDKSFLGTPDLISNSDKKPIECTKAKTLFLSSICTLMRWELLRCVNWDVSREHIGPAGWQ